MHIVKCPFCGKQFDTEKEPFKQVSQRRWAHLSCYENNEKHRLKTEVNINVLKDYINKLFKNVDIDWKTVMSQIKTLTKNGCTYSGIQKTLIYCYEIKKMDILKSNGGIGIVFSMYKEAYEYYKKMNANNNKAINDYKEETVQINIVSPQKNKKIKLLNFGDE